MIIRLDGEELTSKTSLADLVQDHKPGDKVELKVVREDEEMEIKVTLGENPEVSGQAYLGVYYQPVRHPMILEHGEGEHFFDMPFEHFEGELPHFYHDLPGLPHFEALPEGVENAVIVAEVEDGSPADEAGIEAGDLITALDGVPVEDLDSFVNEIAAHDPGEEVSLSIARGMQEIEVKATLTQHPEDSAKAYLGVQVSGFIKIKIEGDLPEHFEFDLQKELDIPGGDA
jgi:S1-C subfamily serine protease